MPDLLASLTDAEKRVLLHMDRYLRWHSILELQSIRLIRRDDALSVPSLIERRLLMQNPRNGLITITASGQVVADEIRIAKRGQNGQ